MTYKLTICQYSDESLRCPEVLVKSGFPTFEQATKEGNAWISKSDNPSNYFFSVVQD